MYIGLHVKYLSILPDFHENLNFLNRLSKNTQISNFMKIGPVGAEFLHADRQTDGQTYMTKLIVTFHNLRMHTALV
jgi:hypothetical protein